MAIAALISTQLATYSDNSLSGGGGSNGTCCTLTPYYGGSDNWSWAQGTYSDPVTLYGYYVSSVNSGKGSLNTVTASTEGIEICNGTSNQTDWNNSGNSPDGTQPWTLAGSGGYADGPFDCLLGHAITAIGSWLISDTTGGLSVNDSDSRYHCWTLAPNVTGNPSDPGYSTNMCP